MVTQFMTNKVFRVVDINHETDVSKTLTLNINALIKKFLVDQKFVTFIFRGTIIGRIPFVINLIS